jgi:hypothetical protein
LPIAREYLANWVESRSIDALWVGGVGGRLICRTGMSNFPVTLNFSMWYAGIGLAPLVAVLALAVFAFYTSLGGQKVFQGSLLED